jgi:hypothetical protein
MTSTHAFVRGTFSSTGFSPGGGIRKKANAGPDPDDMWEEEVLSSYMTIGDSASLLEYDDGFRKMASSNEVAGLFGIYERPEPSFNGCFRPVGRDMPDTASCCRCEPIVRQGQALPADARSRAEAIAEKHRRNRERILGKG